MDNQYNSSPIRMQQPILSNNKSTLDLTPHAVLNRVFGYREFRYHQAEIIDTLMRGDDALVLMPTGGGKSLCYQIPALIRPGTGVVISPLIALMKDQVDALRQYGVRAAFLNSSLDSRSRFEVEKDLLRGNFDLIYIAPERLLTDSMLELLTRIKIALFAIDEAHCVSQWGHDFRKEYQQLCILHQRFPQVPRIALTATADKRTRYEIIQQLDLNRAQVFINSFDRPNIRYQISEDGGSARSRLWNFLEQKHPVDSGIVYCLSRKMVEDAALWLRDKGRNALPYHAKLPDEMRREHQELFLNEDGIIICATIAFGMGIDKPNVRFVAHLNLPKSIEAYYQETGRAGRDGLPANAWMAYGLHDVIMLKEMIDQSDAEEFFKQIAINKLDALVGLCELTSCRRQTLLNYFDEQLAAPCGNCDNCLNPPKTWDATIAAQKALSCAYRTGQRFGVSYLIEVLLGKTTDERIVRNGHERVSTFGIGQDIDAEDWRAVFRQMLARGCLETTPDSFGGLRLTELARPVLKGEMSIYLRKRLPKSRSRDRSESRRNKDSISPQHIELAEALRELRKRLAVEQGVPPFVIFNDITLVDLLNQRSKTHNDLLRVFGIGESKAQRYGKAILECIAAYPLDPILDNKFSDTVNTTLMLFTEGKSPISIAQARNFTLATIYGHLAEAIKVGKLSVDAVIKLDADEYNTIAQAIQEHNVCNTGTFKSVYEALDQRYDYGILKCVAAEECKR